MGTEPTWQITSAPDAPAGASDATRRWAIRCPDGMIRWPGLTRGEGAAHAAAMSASDAHLPDDVLAPVQLPAVLSDGAGPHLLDARGEIVIVIADHPRLSGAVAMGGAGPQHTIGLVSGRTDPPWAWQARVRALAEDRVAVLTALDDAADEGDLDAWHDQWAGED